MCFGAPYEFDAVNLDTGGVGPAPGGTLPDGTRGFVGILPRCNPETEVLTEPCAVIQPEDSEEGGVIATVRIPAGLQGDPWMGR